jgi:hypothetical protein
VAPCRNCGPLNNGGRCHDLTSSYPCSSHCTTLGKSHNPTSGYKSRPVCKFFKVTFLSLPYTISPVTLQQSFNIAMTPADTANEALNETLAAVQLLMKRCMMLRQGDPEALKLSDEIARRLVSVVCCYNVITFINMNAFDKGK